MATAKATWSMASQSVVSNPVRDHKNTKLPCRVGKLFPAARRRMLRQLQAQHGVSRPEPVAPGVVPSALVGNNRAPEINSMTVGPGWKETGMSEYFQTDTHMSCGYNYNGQVASATAADISKVPLKIAVLPTAGGGGGRRPLGGGGAPANRLEIVTLDGRMVDVASMEVGSAHLKEMVADVSYAGQGYDLVGVRVLRFSL